jgi:hypothetical protein
LIRQLVYEALSEDEELQEVVSDRVMSTYDKVPVAPWITIRMGPDRRPQTLPAKQGFFSVWDN